MICHSKTLNFDIETIKLLFVSLVVNKQKSENQKLIKQICANAIKKYLVQDNTSIIEQIVSKYFNIPISLLQKKTRKREIVQARQMEMFFALNYTNLSLAKIGLRYGKKDHATVYHAKKTIENLYDTNKEIKKIIDELKIIIEDNIK